MQNDPNSPTPLGGTPNIQQAPLSNQSGPSPGRFVPSVESFPNQSSPASQQRPQHFHPGYRFPHGEHTGPAPSPRSQASSAGSGVIQFRPTQSPMNRNTSGQGPYYNQSSPFAPISYSNPVSDNAGGFHSNGSSIRSSYRYQSGPFPSKNSPFPVPGPTAGGIGMGGQIHASQTSPFNPLGSGINAGFPGPGPSSNTLGYPGPRPTDSLPYGGSNVSNPVASYFPPPPRINENLGFSGQRPPGVLTRPNLPVGSVSLRPELASGPPILHPQVPPYQLQQMQQEQHMRQQQQEFLRHNQHFVSQPQPRPQPPPSETPVLSSETPNASTHQPSSPAAIPAPAPEPLSSSVLEVPPHLFALPFPGPGPDPDEAPTEIWKERVSTLIPTPTISLISLESLHRRSIGYLCGFAKDIIQEINTRVIHIMSTYRNNAWSAATFADNEVEVKYTRYLFKKLAEIRVYIDRRLIKTPDISANEFIQMVAFTSEKPSIPKEVLKLRETFLKNKDTLVQISSKMKEAEWLSVCADPRATGSTTRDDLLRLTAMEEGRRKAPPSM